MKKTIAILISMVLVIAFGTVVFAAKEAAAPAEKKAEVKMMHQVTGEVAAVDAAANTVTVKKGKKEVVLHVTDKTKMMHGKTIADLKVGEKVKAMYTEEEGKNTAKSIKIEAPKGKETKPAEPAKPAEPVKPAEPATKK